MMTIKNTLKAASAAVLFTAGLAAAQPGTSGLQFDEEAAQKIIFAVDVTPTATITVTNEGLTQASAGFIKTGVVVTGAGPGTATNTAPVLAGKAHIETNLAGWDVWVKSLNGGRLVNAEPATLGCGDPATPAALNVYACLVPAATTGNCGTAAATGATTPRRLIPLTAGTDVSMSQYMNAATAGAATGAKFTGVQNNSGSVHMLIEANVACAQTALAPSPTASAAQSTYSENLTLTLTSNW